MKLPTVEYCEELYETYAVPDPIRRHCKAVTIVGVFLADCLIKKGVSVDRELVDVGCLVHDAFKAASLEVLIARPEWNYVPSSHEMEIWRQLRERFAGTHETLIASEIIRPDFEEFSKFVANIGSTGNPCYLNGGIELKIVHYADWRVQFDQIISFDERLAYLKKAYEESWKKLGISWEDRLKDEKKLEDEIFKHLDFTPNALKAEMGKKSLLV